MTPSELLELAGIVYPGRKVAISAYGDGNRVLVQMEGEFKPSLTGNQQYRAQALDVIVAAFNLPHFRDFHRLSGGNFRFGFEHDEEREVYDGSDLLTASAKALIASRGKG